jgi:glycine oxidase
MIAPTTEAADSSPLIEPMGRYSLSRWPQWLAELPVPVFYREDGTLLLWHRENAGEAERVAKICDLRSTEGHIEHLGNTQVREMEPALGTRFSRALYVRGEAQVDNRSFLLAVALALQDQGVECHWNTYISDDEFPVAGIVVDCRGMGAKCAWPKLRGVRGEIVRLYAPEIELRCMLRLLHPRLPVYIVPRAEGRVVVGATSIESDDQSTISVRGALELLSSAYSVLPGLAEARILEFNTQVRPALPNNAPSIHFDRQRKLLQINGLYRHGFLLTPAIVEEVLTLLCLRKTSRAAPYPGLREGACEIDFTRVQHEVPVCM